MKSRSPTAWLGLAALFLGGVVGGVLGSALIPRPSVQQAPAARPGGTAAAPDPSLARAIEELAREVRSLGSAPAAAEPSRRRPAEGATTPALDFDQLVAALERLTRTLEVAQTRMVPGGEGTTPLFAPPGGKRPDAVAALVGRDWEELSREHRFWTRQQILDLYGTPDEVGDDGRWRFFHDDGETLLAFTFVFVDGFVTNVYN